MPLCHFQDGYGTGGTVRSKNLKVSNNVFIGGNATQVQVSATGVGFIITGNTCEEFGGSVSTAFTHGIAVTTPPAGFIVANNSLISNSAPHASARGIYLNGGANLKHGSVLGNVSSGPGGMIGGAGSVDGRTILTGNTAY